MMQRSRKESTKGVVGIPILIVDDDDFLFEVYQMILEDAGFYVETAVTGEQALAKAKVTQFRLVITDVKLPDIEGEELSRRLKATIPGVSVILLTGTNNSQNEKTAFGASNKPINSLELLRVSTSLSANK